ncbi:MAG: ATP-binding protein [Myxococcales bacterium]
MSVSSDDTERLRQRLEEAEATLNAIREGLVDAVVVRGSEGQQVYTLESADLPYRQFLEQMAEGAVSLDASGHILYCNRFMAELIGRPREELLGVPFDAFIVSPAFAFRDALASDQSQKLGVRLHVSDERELSVQLALTQVGSGDGRRFVVVVSDLTERERMLELNRAREAAEAESLAKDLFFAAVGHDLRTPLNVVVGWSAYLLERRQDYDVHTVSALEAIERNARLQAKLIEDLVDLSRIAAGKLRLERIPLDLSELVRSLGTSLAITAHKRGIQLSVEAEPGVFVMGDASRLEQVLQNLVGNAIKFTPERGSVQVKVARQGIAARIEVRDSGRGIDAQLLPRMFEAFRQGEAPRTRDSGLGLGLAITKHLVDLHEGRVTAHSDGRGRGSLFTVELLALAERSSGTPARPVAPELSSVLHGLRVLVVDDDDDIREITARAVRGFGAEAVSVPGAAAALARLEGEPIDLVVSDLRMPGTNGFELASEIRRRYGSRCKMLAISALSSPDDVDRAFLSGFSAFLPKPLDRDALFGTLSDLASRPAAKQTRAAAGRH